MNFGGIDEEKYSSFDAARVLILPVSYEGTVSYGAGTGAGAMAIVEASRNMELYEEETDSEVYKIGIHTLPEFTARKTPDAMMSELYDYTKDLLTTNKFICMLGGEHSVSAPIIKAHNEKYDNLSVLQIDAHADLRDAYDGTPHSHAQLLSVFFSVAHDPTEVDRQGPDVGPQYRSAIFYANAEQKKVANDYIEAINKAKVFAKPVATQVVALDKFYDAEAYHQDYLVRNPDQPYIVYHDLPKLAALKEKFPDLYFEKKN
jgi:methionine-S-sulfoxide reductase